MKQSNTRLVTPRRIVILLCMILGLAHVILLGWTVQRNQAARQLEKDSLVLQENLDQLQEINQDQLDNLQEELVNIREEISSLEVSFPELGAPFAIYRRGLSIAKENQVELLAISQINSGSVDTISGTILRNQYSIEISGSLVNCLSFLDSLERAGQDTIILEFADFKPGNEECSLEISTLGFPFD